MRDKVIRLPEKDSLADQSFEGQPFEGLPFGSLAEHLARMGENWGWVFAAGIAYVILGIIALSWPVASTLGLTFVLGVLFIASGIIQGIHTIQFRKEAGTAWRLFQTVIALAAGILMLRYPGAGMLGVAIGMAFYFFVSAVAKFELAFGMKPHRGWGWALVSAIASLLLGIYMIATFPISALWVPGLILGIDLIVFGASLCGFSMDLKNVHRKAGYESTSRAFREGRAA